jgi:hypothetical protein
MICDLESFDNDTDPIRGTNDPAILKDPVKLMFR